MATLTVPNNIANGDAMDGSKVDQNFDTIAAFVTANTVQVDGSVALTGLLSLAAASPTVATHAAHKGYVDASMPPGAVTMWAAAVAPATWLLADGAAVSRSTYAALFAAIGTGYGAGDGTTTFNVPNMKGRIPVGLDAAQAEFDVLAEVGGQKTIAAHTHPIATHTHAIDHDHANASVSVTVNDNTTDRVTRLTTGFAGQYLAMSDTDGNGVPDATGGIANNMAVYFETEHGHTASGSVDLPNFTGSTPAGGTTVTNSTGAGVNAMNPYLVINYIIKT